MNDMIKYVDLEEAIEFWLSVFFFAFGMGTGSIPGVFFGGSLVALFTLLLSAILIALSIFMRRRILRQMRNLSNAE